MPDVRIQSRVFHSIVDVQNMSLQLRPTLSRCRNRTAVPYALNATCVCSEPASTTWTSPLSNPTANSPLAALPQAMSERRRAGEGRDGVRSSKKEKRRHWLMAACGGRGVGIESKAKEGVYAGGIAATCCVRGTMEAADAQFNSSSKCSQLTEWRPLLLDPSGFPGMGRGRNSVKDSAPNSDSHYLYVLL